MSTTVGTIIIEAANVIPEPTADSTLWTADSTSTASNAEANNLRLLGNARLAPVEFDNAQLRAPYGDESFLSGTGQRGPESMELHLEVVDVRGLHEASNTLGAILAAVSAAGIIRTPIGVFLADGLLSFTRSPIVNGYSVVVTVGMKNGLHRTDPSLRLIGGSVWVLR